MKYYKYPTKTSMDLLYAPQLTFPAVTLCNMNPIRSSAVDGSSELGTLLDGVGTLFKYFRVYFEH